MKTISSQEFKKLYGETALTQFSQSNNTSVDTKSFTQRVKDDVNKRASNISDAMVGQGEYAGKTGMNRLFGATAELTGAPLNAAYQVLPEVARTGFKKAGEVIGKGFKKVTDKVAETPLFKDIGKLEAEGYLNEQTAPGFSKLKEGLDTISKVGATAGNTAFTAKLPGIVQGQASLGAKAVQTGAKVTAQGAKAVANVAAKPISKFAPKLLSYTSKTPESALQLIKNRGPQVSQALKQHVTPQQALSDVQNATRTLRTTLTEQWKEGSQHLIGEFSGKRMSVPSNMRVKIATVANEFGVELPKNLNKLSIKEALELQTKLNSIPRGSLAMSPKGALAREVSSSFKTSMVDNFGGKGGSISTFYNNYGTKKAVFDAANDIAKAYSTGKPITQTTAVNRLGKIFDQNKPAYLDAIIELEKATGQDLLSKIAATKVTPIMPQISSSGLVGGTIEGALKLLTAPLTSPRSASWIMRMMGKTPGGAKSSVPSIKINGKTLTLDKMHTAEGTKIFQKMNPAQQKAFSAFDMKHSRSLTPQEIPVNKITGQNFSENMPKILKQHLEAAQKSGVPADQNIVQGAEFGRKVTEPIKVIAQPDGTYKLAIDPKTGFADGNHRLSQALLNNDETIPVIIIQP